MFQATALLIFVVYKCVTIVNCQGYLYPKCPSPCTNSPCTCDELESGDEEIGIDTCLLCHSNENTGCTQCNIENGYFKKDDNYPCTNCQEVFGSSCLHCTDYLGCQECVSGYYKKWDNTCGLYYCERNSWSNYFCYTNDADEPQESEICPVYSTVYDKGYIAVCDECFQRNFFQADEFCKANFNGNWLASVHSNEDNEAIYETRCNVESPLNSNNKFNCNNTNAWLGGIDDYVEGYWGYGDGTSFDYTNFYGLPNGTVPIDSNHNCLTQQAGASTWDDQNCCVEGTPCFVCQVD